jgi:hypothetical protein
MPRRSSDVSQAALAVAHGPVDAELGGELHLIAPSGDAPADEHLVVAGPVDVGGVKEGDAEVEGAMDGGDRLIPVTGTVPLTHSHAAKALGRDSEVTQLGGVHRAHAPSPPRGRGAGRN